MNFNPVVRRRIALVSAFSAALVATVYAASEHDRADSMECRAEALEMDIAQVAQSTPSVTSTSAADESPVPKIRQAARDYIQEKKPGAKVEGVFTLVLGRDNSLAIAGADTTIDGQRRTIDVLVRLYARKNGGTYWRAESLGQERAAALMDKSRFANGADGSLESFPGGVGAPE
ncbi:MAG: hypothetical protein V4671_18340 [Armatimonadota bacterium]